jgi:hypothetical protein
VYQSFANQIERLVAKLVHGIVGPFLFALKNGPSPFHIESASMCAC